MKHKSKEGKIPFIELNGEQFHDSEFVMQKVTERFNLEHLESDLTDEEKGITRAMHKLAENSLCE